MTVVLQVVHYQGIRLNAQECYSRWKLSLIHDFYKNFIVYQTKEFTEWFKYYRFLSIFNFDISFYVLYYLKFKYVYNILTSNIPL